MFSFKKLLEEKNRTLVMGILNITPDSFSDGGECISVKDIIEKLRSMETAGVDIIDIGACSTAPMNEIVTEEEELKRLSVLPELVKVAKVPLSVDTFRPSVARFALENGASIVNDESGRFSSEMAEIVKSFGAGWIFMHTGGKSSRKIAAYENGVVNSVSDFFEAVKTEALKYGIKEESLCYDFGIGFGKTRAHDLELLNSCEAFSRFHPLLVGVSRKRVVGEATNCEKPKERVFGSVAAAAVCAYGGAGILRVHDVNETVDAVKMVDCIKKGYI